MSVAAPAVPRNRPCPCGSGRKHKLCCGTTRTEQWALRRREEELTAAAHLAAAVPLARPVSPEFDAWADSVAPALTGADEEENAGLLDAGRALLSGEERARVVETVRRQLSETCEQLEEP